MDMKIHDVTKVSQLTEVAKTTTGDGTFKFTLSSAISDAQLQARVEELMKDTAGEYDFIIDNSDDLQRVQVKTIYYDNNKLRYVASLTSL